MTSPSILRQCVQGSAQIQPLLQAVDTLLLRAVDLLGRVVQADGRLKTELLDDICNDVEQIMSTALALITLVRPIRDEVLGELRADESQTALVGVAARMEAVLGRREDRLDRDGSWFAVICGNLRATVLSLRKLAGNDQPTPEQEALTRDLIARLQRAS